MSDQQPQNAPGAPNGEQDVGRPPRLRLRSLTVHQFREVRPGTELHFADGFHLILGKNGSGKSTLVRLLAAVCALRFRDPFFADTPFHLEASLSFGDFLVHVEAKRTFEPMPIVAGGDLPSTENMEIRVRVEHPSLPEARQVLARTGEGIGVLRANGDPLFVLAGVKVWPGLVGLVLMAVGDPDPRGWAYLHPPFSTIMEKALRQGGPTDTPFDEAIATMHRVVSDEVSITRGKTHATSPWFPLALDFTAEGEPHEIDLARAPVLADAIERLGFDAGKMYFGPGASGPRGWTYSSPVLTFSRGGKPVRRHDQLSFGQQRLFSFAWYLACNPDIAIADELVNGLHSDWIDWCVEAIGDRQCFLTSQNPLLVDAVPLTSEEDIRRGIILCEIAPDTGQLTWRQLDADELDIVSRALAESRLDLLSDLLRALDLW